MNKQLVLSTIMAITLTAAAAPQIEISSSPSLPMPNLAKNSSFETGLKNWRLIKKTDGTGVTSEAAYKGKNCYKIVGDEKTSVGVYQRILFKTPLPAGAPICSSFAMKSEDQDNTLRRPGSAIMVRHTDNSTKYILSPPVPREQHDWILTSLTSFPKKPIKLLTYYFCYYKQYGFSMWDDLTVKAGWVNLKVKVTAKDLKRVRIYGQTQYLVFDSKELKNGTSSFAKDIKVYPMGGYCVETIDTSGIISRKFYPEDSKNTGKDSILPRFNEEQIVQGDKLTCEFKNPASGSEKVYLDFNVRSNNKNIRNIAGWSSGALKIKLNGKAVNPDRLVGRKVFFTRSNGKVGKVGKDSFIAFFSPWCFSIDTENPYCPVDIEGRNPFKYVLDISNLVKPGKNVLEFFNRIRKNPRYKSNVYISSAKVLKK